MKKEKICGIYIWTNVLNNNKYVGCSRDIYKRWHQHEVLSLIKKRKFYNAIRKYGIEGFIKEIKETYPQTITDKELKIREDYYIDLYNSIKNGYNIEKEYNTISDHPEFDRIKKQISDKAKLRKWINNGEKNITVSPEKINDYINNGWNLGRLPFTKEHKNQLSISHKDFSPTKITREKLSKLWLGRHHSQETKDNMSKKLEGRYSSEWYIEKYGADEGMKKYHEHHDKAANSIRGKIIVNNDYVNKLIYKEELEQFIELGWAKGKLWKNKN